MQFSREEQERYQSHFSLSQVGPGGQTKLKAARVLIIGAGGLGNPIAIYLAAAGVGQITLVDHDLVSLSNLQRQILFTSSDVGLKKVSIAQERLQRLNPNIRVDIIAKAFSITNATELVRNHDLVIDGTDNFETRYLINDVCVSENKTFVFGAVGRFDAQVSVFHYQNGPCYRCLYPKPPPLEAVANCSEAGVLGVLPGTVGTFMANEALKLILGIGEILSGKLLVYDSLRSETQKRKFSRNLECTACGVNPVHVQTQAQVFRQMTFDQIRSIEDFFVMDVRQPSEFFKNHLPTAINIALPEIKNKLSSLPRDLKILLVCKSGRRSQRAAEILTSFGFENLFQLVGGMDNLGDSYGV